MAYIVAFSPDGRCLAWVAKGTLVIWDTATGQDLFPLSGHEGFATSVAFSPDGRRLASG